MKITLNKKFHTLVKLLTKLHKEVKNGNVEKRYFYDDFVTFDYPDYCGIKQFGNVSCDLIDAIQYTFSDYTLPELKKMSTQKFITVVLENGCYSFFTEFATVTIGNKKLDV